MLTPRPGTGRGRGGRGKTYIHVHVPAKYFEDPGIIPRFHGNSQNLKFSYPNPEKLIILVAGPTRAL